MFNFFSKRDKKPLTEGEEFIKIFLEDNRIKHKCQVEIPYLTGDDKQYRIADFYLPRLKIYIEFNGYWNMGEESKERYREKKRVYSNNNIACIYLYPENLGFISFVFHKRMIKELKDKGMRFQLFRYKWNRYIQSYRNWFATTIYIPLVIIWIFFGYDTGVTEDFLRIIFIFCVGIFIWGIYRLTRGFIRYMILNN